MSKARGRRKLVHVERRPEDRTPRRLMHGDWTGHRNTTGRMAKNYIVSEESIWREDSETTKDTFLGILGLRAWAGFTGFGRALQRPHLATAGFMLNVTELVRVSLVPAMASRASLSSSPPVSPDH
ncbi:hypothetical protein E2C01_006060 [Portunus trituberculatus]|uniref:Uncharacterized protein n=1 Tax=Portunus trituberculatus TaxID=210409 RepID=A0A5B7CVC7_PORTR|nr:hypothetical protein [Portunus trituberculatus]